MAFFMFLYMYLQILLLAYAVADGVYWNLSTTPAIFGQEITLTCHLEEIFTNPTECAERKWIVDPGNKVLTNRGVSSENKKYIEDISQHNPTFDLMIMNLAESDLNVDYTCTCGFKTFSKKLVLKEERFHYPPIVTNTNFSVHNGLVKVTVHMTKVYPVPNCSLMVGDSFIQSKAVRYSQNGIVYTVDFNAEYKFREKDCNKKPIVVCTFGMVSGPVRFEGDETYKCLIIKCTAPGISKFTITSTNTDVVPSTEVKYTCEFGYQLPAGDLGTRICQLGGTWSAPPPACEVIKCTAPKINKFTNTSTNTDVVPSTEVTYTCEFGYQLPAGDLGTRTCQLGGTWPAPPPACEVIKCTAPEINKFTNTSTNTSVVPSTEVTYTCEFCCNLPAEDLGTRICQLGGTWPAPPPACEGLFCTQNCSFVARLFFMCGKVIQEEPVSEKERRLENEHIVTFDNGETLAVLAGCVGSIFILTIPICILALVLSVMNSICNSKETRDANSEKNIKKG